MNSLEQPIEANSQAATSDWLGEQVREPIERTPAFVRLLKRVDPNSDTLHSIERGTVVKVHRVDADRRGVEVFTPAGARISLHPSEFLVMEWSEEPRKPR